MERDSEGTDFSIQVNFEQKLVRVNIGFSEFVFSADEAIWVGEAITRAAKQALGEKQSA